MSLDVFRKAVALRKDGAWHQAVRELDEFIRYSPDFKGAKGNRTLAEAFYNRALCRARLGQRAHAVHDLHECVRIGPEDEQMTEDDASCVPTAHVALFVLLTSEPHLAEEAQAIKEAAADEAIAPTEDEADHSDLACFEGKLWRAPVTMLDPAVERSCASGRTPLILDSTGTADVAFLYKHATIIEAKQLVLEVRSPARSAHALASARWALRKKLVHALRWGHTLVVRLSDTAPDFAYYCHEAYFPLALFDRGTLPRGKDAARDAVFKQVLREKDVADTGGAFFVPESFNVVVTSTFSPDVYETHLTDALPQLETNVQPVALFEPSDAAREAEALAAQALKRETLAEAGSEGAAGAHACGMHAPKPTDDGVD